MAIDVNPLQIGALAALAGNNIGNLNLPVPDWGGYGKNYADNVIKRLGLLQQANNAQADRDTSIQLANMHQQSQKEQQMMGIMAQLQQQNSAQQFQHGENIANRQFQGEQSGLDRGLRVQEMMQNRAYQQGMLGNDSRRIDLEQQRMDQEAQANEDQKQMMQAQMALKQRAELDKADLNRRGAFGSLLLAGAYDLPQDNPAMLGDYLKKKIELGYKEGIITKEEYQQSLQMSPDEVLQHASMDVLLSGHAVNAKDNPVLMNALKMITSGNSNDNATTSKQSQAMAAQGHQLQQAESLLDKIKSSPEVFTTVGNAFAEGNVTADRNSLLAPLIHGAAAVVGADPKKLDDDKTDIDAKTSMLWADIAKNLSPRLISSANQDFKNNLIPNSAHDSYDNAMQKTQSLINIIKQKQVLDQKYIKNGVMMNQEAYDNALMSLISGGAGSSTPVSNTSYTYQGKKASLESWMKANPGMTKEQILQMLGQ